jgi:cellulose synthase/poly-beta-1,6-N-acetylglucosamine synthase-like glycosyltransferase
MKIFALLPAHNEAANIANAVRALQNQTVRPHRVIVVADNCTDSTAELAAAAGAEVLETVGNSHKKAGALNQALSRILLESRPDDVVLVQDADSVLSVSFLETALERVQEAGVGAVGGVFYARNPGRVLEHFQANEYSRYAREISRTGRVMVLTGTATMFRAGALRHLAACRGYLLPGQQGEVYNTSAITEDNEVTLALKTLGYRMSSPLTCEVNTEIMPTVSALMKQRERWYRGAIDNLRTYGLTRVTARYWAQQAMLCLGVVGMWLYATMMTLAACAGTLSFSPFWIAVGGVFWLERVVTSRRSTPAGRLLAALLVPEMIYEMILQLAFVRGAYASLRGSTPEWHHATA